MLHRIMSNKNLEVLNETTSLKQLASVKKNSTNINPKSKDAINLNIQNCEILVDQYSNSNSDESSESSSAESGGDQRTMDAADTLLSIANTPTTEFKAFLTNCDTTNRLPANGKNENSFEISVNNENIIENTISLEDLTKDLASASSHAKGDDLLVDDTEKEQFESAVQLILSRASKKFGTKMPTSITIKTTKNLANPDPAKANTDSKTSNRESNAPNDQDKNEQTSKPTTFNQDFTNRPSKFHSSTPTMPATPTMSNLIKSFTNTNTAPLPGAITQTASSPGVSSSSLMFLSTGQAKKQKKFRLDAAEFSPNFTNQIISTQTIEPSQKPIENTPVELIKLVKIEPVLNQDSESNEVVEMFNQSSSTNKLKARKNDMFDVSEVNSDSDTSVCSGDPVTRKHKRLNSTSSSISNLNETSMSMYSVRQAPTLATGRRSKDVLLPPDEAKKRQERRDRNKEAAARCRRKREDQTQNLTHQTEVLTKQQESLKRKFKELSCEKTRLEKLLQSHEKACNASNNDRNGHAKTINHVNNDIANSMGNGDLTIQQQSQHIQSQHHQQLIRIKKEEIDDIKKISSEKIQQKLTINTGGNSQNNQTQTSSNSTTNSNVYTSNSSSGLSNTYHEKNNVFSPDQSNRSHFMHSLKQQQPNNNLQNQINNDLFHQMLNNIDQHQSLTPVSNSPGNSESYFFPGSNVAKSNQLKRPGNLELNKQTSSKVSSFHTNNNEFSRKMKEQNSNTAALYHIINSASNSTLINNNSNITTPHQYNQTRNNCLSLTPTFSLNTPILKYGPLSFALTPLFDYPLTPSVLQQHLGNTPIEKVNDQNAGGN